MGSADTVGGVSGTLYTISPSSIQNGGPDGFAVALDGVLCEFLSYEGDFAGMGGIADGVTSTDVGVSESSAALVGSAIQLIDGAWTFTDGINTLGTPNAVPEPGAFALLLMGGLFLVRRR